MAMLVMVFPQPISMSSATPLLCVSEGRMPKRSQAKRQADC
ncbi:MAG: hypothetical protein ACLUAB_01720 [Ruminococcus sp.]